MSVLRCQICGRRKHLRRNGTLVHYFTGGLRCPGSGYPPIEIDDARLVDYTAIIETAFDQACHAVRTLEDARANWVNPALLAKRGMLAGESLRLNRRLTRHRQWPERYRRSIARQMEQHGYVWADPPPTYLVQREQDEQTMRSNGKGTLAG